MKNIKAVILDWAGTSVDFGCMGPAMVFVDVFRKWDIELSPEQARIPMGLAKKDHTRVLLQMPEISQQWLAIYGERPTESDVEEIFSLLGPAMNEVINDFAAPVPGIIKFMESLRYNKIKIGSTTGYMPEIMKKLIPRAALMGFAPDCIVTPEEVAEGRPAPFMCYLNALRLGVFPFSKMVKIGDTVADIQEGLNAGMWTIGVTKSGNEVGMSWDGINEADPFIVSTLVKKAEEKLRSAGAHYIVEGVWDCLPVLEDINRRIEQEQLPNASFKMNHSISI